MSETVLVAGGTGWLGRQIAEELLSRGVKVRLLLRGGERHPKSTDFQGRDRARLSIVDGDLETPTSLHRSVDGIHVIVSAVQGGPEIIIDGQRALAEAGKQAGVVRMYPSDFAVDFTNIPISDHLFLGWRKMAQAAIADTGLSQSNTYNGAFMEMLRQPFFGLVDWDAREVTHWGAPDQVYDFTTTADTAKYVAAAVATGREIDGPFRVAGDSQSPAQIAAILSEATGRDFAARQLGSLEELDAIIAAKQAASPDNPMPWVGLQYHKAMVSGAGRLSTLDNSIAPDVKPMRIGDYVAATQVASS